MHNETIIIQISRAKATETIHSHLHYLPFLSISCEYLLSHQFMISILRIISLCVNKLIISE